MKIEIQTEKIRHQENKARRITNVKMQGISTLPKEYAAKGNSVYLNKLGQIVATTDDYNIGAFFGAIKKKQMPVMQIMLPKNAILLEDEFLIFMHFINECASRLRQIKNKHREEQKEDEWQGRDDFHI